MWLLFLIPAILFLSPGADACMRTNPGTTPTTMAPNAACAGCTVDNPAVEVLRVSDGNKALASDTVSIDATTGCAVRKMTCTGNGQGSTVALEWNRGQNGFTLGTDGGNYVEDTLVCDGTNWFLSKDTAQANPITTVECTAT